VIEFAPLFTIEVEHAYYGGRCPDFDFWVPELTARRLAGAHLLAKQRESQLAVFHEKGFAPLADGTLLRFGLKLVNPWFANFTALPFPPGEALALYRNDGVDAALEGPLTLMLDPAVAEDAELMRAHLFALAEITTGDALYDAAEPPAFKMRFEARTEQLHYYVVARGYSQNDFDQFRVSDAGFGTDSRPEILFSRVNQLTGDGVLPPSALGADGAMVTLFRSRDPVARQEKARRRIQLARGNQILIPQLPQPAAAAPTANLVVHLSK
jgi:hypothetical protein